MLAPLKALAIQIRDFLAEPTLQALRAAPDGPDAGTQIQLMLMYRKLLETPGRLPALSEVGFPRPSQADEDGILLFLFSVIGVLNRQCAELCAGDGIECN